MAKKLMAMMIGLAFLGSAGAARAGYSKEDCADKPADKYDAKQCNNTALRQAYVTQMQSICAVEAGFVVDTKDKKKEGVKKLHLESLYKVQWELVRVCNLLKGLPANAK